MTAQQSQPEPSARTFKYWAFISYSHTDKSWGDWLHRALETYRVPKRLVGSPSHGAEIPARLFPIFRDREELPVSASLPENISFALEQSRYLIVICSPRSAASRWVNEEIKTFKRLGREDRVLALIVAGEPNASQDGGKPGFQSEDECFPQALRCRWATDGNLSSERTEPIAADARPGKDGKSNAKLKLLAGLLQVDYDQLKQRDHERRIRRLRAVVMAALALAGVLGGLTVYSILQRQRAEAALTQGENLIGFMLGELETGRLDMGGNQEVLLSINEQVKKYYTALPTEKRKASGNMLLRYATLMGAKTYMLNGNVDKMMQSLNELRQLAQDAPEPPAEGRDVERMFKFAAEIIQLASRAAPAPVNEQTLQAEADKLRKTPLTGSNKFAIHMELAMELCPLGLALSSHAPAEAEKILLEAVAISDALPADEQEFVRVRTVASPKDPPSPALRAMIEAESKLCRCEVLWGLARVRLAGGKSAEALEDFHQSLQAARDIAGSPTFGSFARGLMAGAQSEIGSILDGQKQTDEALASFRDSLRLLEELMNADSSNVLWPNAYADVLGKIAGILDKQGKTEEALADYRTALQTRQRLLKQNPKMPKCVNGEASACNGIGDVLAEQGHYKEAVEMQTAAVAGERRALELEPGDVADRDLLAEYQDDLADALNKEGETDRARAVYREAAGYWRQHAAAKSQDANIPDQLTIALDGLGTVTDRLAVALSNQNKIPEALAGFQDALATFGEAKEIRRQQAAAAPDDADAQGRFSYFLSQEAAVHDQAAQALDKQGNLPEALRRYQDALAALREAVDIRRKMVARKPQEAKFQTALANFLDQLSGVAWRTAQAQDRQGNVPEMMARYGEAADAEREGVEFWRGRAAADPRDVNAQNSLTNFLDGQFRIVFQWAHAAARHGDAPASAARYRDAGTIAQEEEDIWRARVATAPQNADSQASLAHSLGNAGAVCDGMARALAKEKKLAEAVALFREGSSKRREALDLWRQRLAANPQDANARTAVKNFLNAWTDIRVRLAEALKKQGQTAESADAYRQTLAAAGDVISQSPPDAELLWTRARVQAASGDQAGAIRDFQAAVGLSPALPALRQSYAWALADFDRPADALEQFGEAAKLDPASAKNEDIQAGLAVGHWQLDQRDEAVAAFRRLIGIKADYTREDFVAQLDRREKEIALLQAVRGAAIPTATLPSPVPKPK